MVLSQKFEVLTKFLFLLAFINMLLFKFNLMASKIAASDA